MNERAFLERVEVLQKVQREVVEESEATGKEKRRTGSRHIPTHWLLVLQSGVAGIYYYEASEDAKDGDKVFASIDPGEELRMVREYNNIHDQWAISLYTQEGNCIGYISRFKNETIARLMDVGKVFHAIVDKPVNLPADPTELRRVKAPTENYKIPYSVYMEDEMMDEEGEE